MAIVARDIDSALGRWTHHEWRPAQLAGVVERIWHFDGLTTHRRERLFPNGMVELVVQLDEPHWLIARGRTRTPALCVTGLQTGAMLIESPGRCRVMGIRLHPAGAYALLARPVHELTGRTIALADIARHAAEELGNRCADARGAEARMRIAAAWAAERVARAPPLDRSIAWSAAVPIAGLRARTGQSKRRHVAAFRAQIGLTPKLYARIVRFRRALAELEGPAPLAEIASACGYYDQPHMNAEFRALAGLTPRRLRAANRYPETASLAEAG
jgi:AraC-like DNA-binding protein